MIDQIGASRAQLDPTTGGTIDPAQAHALYGKLLPFQPNLLTGLTSLLIVPHGATESLPFGVLVASAPGTEKDPTKVDWLAKHYSTVTPPSMSSLRALRTPVTPSRAAEPFRGIGNPVLAGGASVVAFATHASVAADLPGLAEPALALTPPAVATENDDGLLTASEAATLKLDADFVILSDCNTASPDGSPGAPGLSGLAKAAGPCSSRIGRSRVRLPRGSPAACSLHSQRIRLFLAPRPCASPSSR